MKKINIGFVISYVGSFGPANVVYNIIKYLPKEYFNIFLIILTNNKRNNEEKFKKLGIKIINLNLSKFEGLLCGKNKLKKVALENNIDILHSHCLLSCLLVSEIKKVKKISTLHCDIRAVYLLYYGKLKGYLMFNLHRIVLKKYDAIIACSETVQKESKKYINFNIGCIKNGVEIKDYYLSYSKETLRLKLGLSLNKKYFISVGRFNENKQIYFIAKEFTKMKLENCSLILLGNSYDGKSVEEKILALNNEDIIMPGRVENVNEYLNAADYFVSASLYEGLPNSVLEACCAKLPLILSNIPPHREILGISKTAGVLFEPKNAVDFFDKVNEILKKNYEKLKQNSFEIVNENLRAEKMSKQYLDIYNFFIKN